MREPHTEIIVNHIPDCFVSRHGKAYADARIPANGSWGYVCERCFVKFGCTLGLGKGQRLVLDEPIERITSRLGQPNQGGGNG